MAPRSYTRCQVCQDRVSAQGGVCIECASVRAEAQVRLDRYPQIRTMSRIGVERTVGTPVPWPLSDALRWLSPRQLVAVMGTGR